MNFGNPKTAFHYDEYILARIWYASITFKIEKGIRKQYALTVYRSNVKSKSTAVHIIRTSGKHTRFRLCNERGQEINRQVIDKKKGLSRLWVNLSMKEPKKIPDRDFLCKMYIYKTICAAQTIIGSVTTDISVDNITISTAYV